MTPRRHATRQSLAMTLLLLGVLPSWRPLSAQVGHEPGGSPYRDLTHASGPAFFVGVLGGERGRAGVGPSNGRTFGVRYDLQAGRSMIFQLGATYLKADRFIVDPQAAETSATRRTGPADTEILLTEAALLLRLTGGKTWHGLAPYAGFASGLAFDMKSPGDSTGSGYEFGTKFLLSFDTGVRWHAGQHVTVQADWHALLWRLGYPSSFHDLAPDQSRVVPLPDPLTDWTFHPWASLGIGWTF